MKMTLQKIRNLLREELQLESQKDALSDEFQNLNEIYQNMVEELDELNQKFQKNIKIRNGITDYRTWKSDILNFERLLFELKNEIFSLEPESVDNYLQNNLPKGIQITQQMKLRQIQKLNEKNTETNKKIQDVEKDISRVVDLMMKQKEFFDYEMEIKILEEKRIFENPFLYLDTFYSNSINDLKIIINEKRKEITPIEANKIKIEEQLSTLTEQLENFDNYIEKAYNNNLLTIENDKGFTKLIFAPKLTDLSKKQKIKINNKNIDLLDILNFNENYKLLSEY